MSYMLTFINKALYVLAFLFAVVNGFPPPDWTDEK